MKFSYIISAAACLTLAAIVPVQAQAPAGPAITVRQATVNDPGYPVIPVAIFAPANGSALPLVVISHGTGASMISHIDTAQALANAGFVVVAPMHPGDNFQDDSAVGKPQWFVDRSRHVSKVIDFMTAQWEGHDRLAPNGIGLFGLSAGATTALISVGGNPDLAGVPAYCARTPEFVCKIMGPPAASPADAPPMTTDKRVAAVVLAAPGLGFAFAPSGLANVTVPVQLWTGEADNTVPTATNAAVVRELLTTPVDYHSVPGAAHLSFLAPCGPDSPPFICKDPDGFDRAAFHQKFNQSIIAFFNKHLRAQRPE